SPSWACSRSEIACGSWRCRSRPVRAWGRYCASWACCATPLMQLSERIEALAAAQRPQYGEADRALFAEFRAALSRGTVRAAERRAAGTWRVNAWVKRGILLGVRMGALADMSPPRSPLRFFDKDTYPTRATTLAEGVRIVPGGSSTRDGAYVAPGVVWMPPMYVNVGADVVERLTGRDHAVVGTGAHTGQRVHSTRRALG